MRLIILIAY